MRWVCNESVHWYRNNLILVMRHNTQRCAHLENVKKLCVKFYKQSLLYIVYIFFSSEALRDINESLSTDETGLSVRSVTTILCDAEMMSRIWLWWALCCVLQLVEHYSYKPDGLLRVLTETCPRPSHDSVVSTVTSLRNAAVTMCSRISFKEKTLKCTDMSDYI